MCDNPPSTDDHRTQPATDSPPSTETTERARERPISFPLGSAINRERERETETERCPGRLVGGGETPAPATSKLRIVWQINMARRRAKKTVKKSPSSLVNDVNGAVETEAQIDKDQAAFTDQEVERQSAAIRAIRDVEIEHLLTELRLLRSYFSKEQLQTPALKFFKENLLNLSVVGNEGNKQFEVQWNDEDGNLSMNQGDGRDIHTSLLRRLSMAYPDCSATIASLGGFQFSSKAVKTSLLGAGNLQISDFVLEESFDTQMLGMQDGLRTPGVSSQRLSVGMTPKTLRLPKPGEMLLSVHGSPLGVFKEDNMEAIHEFEEG